MAGKEGNWDKAGDPNKAKGWKEGKRTGHDLDWDALMKEWVTTNISLSGLSLKYGLSMSAIRRQYYKRNWVAELRKFNNMVEEETIKSLKDKAKEIANRGIELDEVILSTSEKIVGILDEKVSELADIDGVVKAEDITDLVQVLKKTTEALRTAHYNIRLANDRATLIIDDRTSKEGKFSEEEKQRIAEELGLLSKTNKNDNNG